MAELTPRERVLLALSHQETDRVPVDFLATPETWTRLGRHLGTGDSELILRKLGIDLRHLRQPYVGPTRPPGAEGTWTDEWGVPRRRVAHAGGSYDEIASHPLAAAESLRDIDNYSWPRPEWWDAEALSTRIREMDRGETYAIALSEFGDPGGIFETAWYLRGMEKLLVDMVERPEWAWKLLERVTGCLVGRLENVMAAVGTRADLIWTSDDVAHQRGPLISPGLWRELVAPHHERLNQRVHELGARVMYHSCGAIRRFIPGFVEIGVDVLDVLQFSADGMDPGEIKSSFGDVLCFHGGVDVQRLLPFAGERDLRSRVREITGIMGRGGGFILSPSHNVQVDTPIESILALYREAGSLEEGRA